MAVTPYPAHIPVLSDYGNLEPSSQPHALSSKNIFQKAFPNPSPLVNMCHVHLPPVTCHPNTTSIIFFEMSTALSFVCFLPLGPWLHQPEHNGRPTDTELSASPHSHPKTQPQLAPILATQEGTR